MSTSQAVAQHLPFLRRYARALTGSQHSGDAYVAAALEALIEDPSVAERRQRAARRRSTGCSPKSGIRSRSTAAPSRDGGQAAGRAAARPDHPAAPPGVPAGRAGRLFRGGRRRNPRHRRVDAASLVEESGRELAAEIATDVLIIEDETFIAMDLEGLVESLGHRVIGVARTHAAAVTLAKAKRPGLILADIQLADGSSGLDAVNELLQIVRGAGDLHHRLSGALPDRRAAGAGVPDRQAVPARDGVGGDQPGAVLRAQGAAAAAARGSLIRRKPSL